MKSFSHLLSAVLILTAAAHASVTVSSPKNGATVTSPAVYVATSSASGCSKGVASMGVYINNKLNYVVHGNTLNTSIKLAAGKQHTVVEEWDHCGKATYTTINVTVADATASTVAVAASPATIAAGSASVLSVTATNARTVKISGSNGTSYTLGAEGGEQSVSPSATTTYTVTAAGAGGNSSAQTTVTVTSAPLVSVTATPAAIAPSGSSNLTVAATRATLVTVTGSDGSSYTLGAKGGTQKVSPAATTTYTATATGSGGTTTATTTVTVNQAPTVSVAASPASIAAGSASSLSVEANNATKVTVKGSDGSSYVLANSGGTASVKPARSTTYTATATGAGGTSSAAAMVTVSPGPTVSLTASPASVPAGGSSTLTVAAANAVQVTLAGSDGSSYTFGATGGTQTVSPSATTTYTATAVNAVSKSTSLTTVTIQGAQSTLTNLQTSSGWESWGQLPPNYADCSPCNGIKWSMDQNVGSPSLSGNASKFNTSGSKPYAVVLWYNPVIGAYSTQGLPDKDKTLVPSLHNFTYDLDFYVTDASITFALEFDVAMYLNKDGLFFGTQCVLGGDKKWDVLDAQTGHWMPSSAPCTFVNGWNHLTLEFERESGDKLLYKSVALNGVTYPLNMTYPPKKVSSSWYGITVNYQMDGDKTQAANTTYLDNVSLTYW
jgi:hypothetical protein